MGGARRMSTLAAARTARPLSSAAAAAVGAPRVLPAAGGGSPLAKLGLVAACGLSAAFGAMVGAQK